MRIKKFKNKQSFNRKKRFSHTVHYHNKSTELSTVFQKREVLNINSTSKKPILQKVPALNDNKTFVLSLIRQNPSNYKFISNRLKNDLSITLVALELDGMLLEHVGDTIKNNRILTSTAVKNNGLALEHADPKFQDDNDIVALAMHQNMYAKYFVGPKMKLKFYSEKKRELLLAVQTDGTLLRFAESEFRNDFDIVWSAVNQNGLALEFASFKLKSDRFIVTEAVKQYGPSLVYAGKFLKHDTDLLMLANINSPTTAQPFIPVNPWKISYSKLSF